MNQPLNYYVASVTIEAETLEDAEQVLAERLGYDKDYGFPYTLKYDDPQLICKNPSENEDILRYHTCHIEIGLKGNNRVIRTQPRFWESINRELSRFADAMSKNLPISITAISGKNGLTLCTIIPSAIAWLEVVND
jgi:hypothetical protein